MHHRLCINQEGFHEKYLECTGILCVQDVYHIISCIAPGKLGAVERLKMVETHKAWKI